MKQLFAGLLALAALFSISISALQGQTALPANTIAGPFRYDATTEVTISGSISSVLMTPSSGMVNGAHLLLSTSSGAVDVSLGVFALIGKGALAAEPGQQVEVCGVIKTVNRSQVLLARTVKVKDQIYIIRNAHGIPLSPQARERASKKIAQNGDTL